MWKFISFWIVCLGLITSCSSGSTPQAVVDTIDFGQVEEKNFELDSLEYVPLETTDSVLLGSVDKVLFRNNRFFVLDKTSGGVYIFGRKGNFISSIVKPGGGPGEYIELMDMDVDEKGDVYVADNARMNILKYKNADAAQCEVIHVGEHFFEFACLGAHAFLLSDVFGKDGQKMKLAYFDAKQNKITPLLKQKSSSVDELAIMKCTKHYLYRSGDNLYYNERFSPDIYSISPAGKMEKVYVIASEKYVTTPVLKSLEKNPVKFLQEKTAIKDLICLYENSDYFICMPFIVPSATYLVIPKRDIRQAGKINLMDKPECVGASFIEGVADDKFFMVLNPLSDSAQEVYRETMQSADGEENPVLMLFSLK